MPKRPPPSPEPEPEPEPTPEPEPEPAPAPRTTVSYVADPGPEGPNLPPSIHSQGQAPAPEGGSSSTERPVVRAPDTSEQGYAVTIKPVVAKALGTYLPKALQKISDTLGGKAPTADG